MSEDTPTNINNPALLGGDGLTRRPSEALAALGADPQVIRDVQTLEGLAEATHLLHDVIPDSLKRISQAAQRLNDLVTTGEAPPDLVASAKEDPLYTRIMEREVIERIITMVARFENASGDVEMNEGENPTEVADGDRACTSPSCVIRRALARAIATEGDDRLGRLLSALADGIAEGLVDVIGPDDLPGDILDSMPDAIKEAMGLGESDTIHDPDLCPEGPFIIAKGGNA